MPTYGANLDVVRRHSLALREATDVLVRAIDNVSIVANGGTPMPLGTPPAPPPLRGQTAGGAQLDERSIDETIDSFRGNEDEDVEGKLHRALAASQRHHRYTPPPVPPLEERHTRPGGGRVDGPDYGEGR